MDRAEHRLLLACVPARGDVERQASFLDCISQGVDWETLLDAAARHRLTSLLYWHLNSLCREKVPAGVLERLHEHFLQNTARVLLLTARLQQILSRLNGRNIRAIPYKGPALAHSLYEEPGAREFDDLDILVERDNVQPALEVLSELGYEGGGPLRAWTRAELVRQGHHWAMSRQGQVVEVHWTVHDRARGNCPNLERWWVGALPATLAGHSVTALRPEHLLVALCLHGATHAWASLHWLADVTRLLLHHPALAWDEVRKDTDDPDVRRMLRLGVGLAMTVGRAHLPDALRAEALDDPVVARLLRHVVGRQFPAAGRAEVVPALHRVAFKSALITAWPRRLAYWRSTALLQGLLLYDKVVPPRS
jgi:hypothetical protein